MIIRVTSSKIFSGVNEISDLLLFVSYFASQSEEIKFGNYSTFVMCVVEINTFWLDVRYPQQAILQK